MIASRDHCRLSTPAARQLDLELRAHLARASGEPEPCFVGHDEFTAQAEQMAIISNLTFGYDGRMKWLKQLMARILRPIVGRQSNFNYWVLEQLGELHAKRTLDCNLCEEMRHELAHLLAKLKKELREELLASPALMKSRRD